MLKIRILPGDHRQSIAESQVTEGSMKRILCEVRTRPADANRLRVPENLDSVIHNRFLFPIHHVLYLCGITSGCCSTRAPPLDVRSIGPVLLQEQAEERMKWRDPQLVQARRWRCG